MFHQHRRESMYVHVIVTFERHSPVIACFFFLILLLLAVDCKGLARMVTESASDHTYR